MSMCVQNVGVNNSAAYRPNFKGASDVKEIDKGSYIERHVTTEASNGKKWGVGIASLFISGLGQFINGDVGKGFAFLGGGIASYVLANAAIMRGKLGLAAVAGIAALGTGIASIVDAVKSAKSETVQIVNKGE